LAVFFAALTFAQRARCADAILFRAAADSVRFFGIVITFCSPSFALTFALVLSDLPRFLSVQPLTFSEFLSVVRMLQ
jgi:hypothetical protein